MKTKEAIEALARELAKLEFVEGSLSYNIYDKGIIAGYTQCQQDNKPVDVEKFKQFLIQKYESMMPKQREFEDLFSGSSIIDAIEFGEKKSEERERLMFLRAISDIDEDLKHLSNTSEDKEAFALDFVCWLMEFCELQKDSETEENVLWSYDGEDYSMEGLLKLYKDSLPQPPKQTLNK